MEADLMKVFRVEASGSLMSLCLFVIFLLLLYWYSVLPYSVLSRCGIRHPRPIPFFGNMFMFRQGFLDPINELIKTHGRVCGYYFGRTPVVVVADPDMLRQVLVKEFSSFPNRMVLLTGTKPMSDSLVMLRDEQWKRVRSIVTPSFSPAKIKEMVPLINRVTHCLMNNLNAHADSEEAFDIHRYIGCFTMDVIASVGFGTQVVSQNDADPFLHHAQSFFSFSFFRPITLIAIAFPFILPPLVRIFPNKGRNALSRFFTNYIQRIIRQRDEQPPEQRRRDVMQLMLDARSSKECVPLEHFSVVNHADELAHTHQVAPEQDHAQAWGEPSANRPQKGVMTEDELVGQAFIFLLAGYETSGSTLAFTCYLLAMHTECQRKVQEEVDDFFIRHDSLDHTNVGELKYLDMVVSETLRLYPPGFRFSRSVDQDCVVNGQFLPRGASVEINVRCLHYDPQHWPEPERFIPERFTAEAKANRHPFVYLPFGAGPRGCLGMRLAQLVIKMALVHLFRRFTIAACAETKVPLEVMSLITLRPKNGILVKVGKRVVAQSRVNPDE